MARLVGRRHWPLRLLAVVNALVLAAGVFLVVGAASVHPVSAAEAVGRYQDRPGFTGLPGWDRPLAGPRPEPGVYLYRTTGYAAVDRLGIRRDYPATTARIIRNGPGCQWREQVAIFSEHLETYSACAQGADQADTGFGTRLTYFYVPASTDLVCGPGGTRTGTGLAPQGSRSTDCRDDDRGVRSRSTWTYLGPGSATVDGRSVACRRVRILSVLSGSTVGVASREVCTTPDTGLVLTERRNVSLGTSNPFIGAVRYVEVAEFALTSLRPES